MTDSARTNLGSALLISADGAHRRWAGRLERAGFGSLWIQGGQLDSLDRIGEALDATDTIEVGTAVIALDRHPAQELIRLCRMLTQRHPGRFVLGLGGPQRPHPLPALEHYLDELDAAGIPPGELILAALGPKKLAMAAERTAGAIPLLVTPSWVAEARRSVGPRSRLVVMVPAGLERSAAMAAGREQLDFLLRVEGYRQNLRRCEFSDEQLDRRDDAVVDGVAAIGSPARVRERIDEYLDAGADQVVITPLTNGEQAVREALQIIGG